MTIETQLAEIQSRISRVSARKIDLVAVTKTVSADVLKEAYGLGLRNFGENKVQELLEKQVLLPQDIRWHMIGRLQTNKVKDILGRVALIHSLDRIDLYEKIVAEAHKKKLSQVECLLQVNMSGEISKAGFSPEQIPEFLNQVAADSPVKIRGPSS
jgi:PLP dependent protein